MTRVNDGASRLPSWTLPTHGTGRYLVEAALFVPLYLLLDWASYIEPLGAFNITPWNPGPALAIVWVMRAGLSKAPVILVAAFLADDIVRDLPGAYAITLLSALTLTAGYSLIAATLRVLLPLERSLDTTRGVTVLVAVVAIGSAINGLGFLAVLALAGLLDVDLLAQGWLRFWIGDVVGILATAPLLLIAVDRERRAQLVHLPRRAESYLQVGLVGVTLWIILAGLGPLPSHGFFLLFPPLILIALRSGLAGALAAIAIVQLGIVIAFHQRIEAALPIVDLQVLVATLTLTGLYLGVMVDERQRTRERLNQSLRLAAAGEMAGAITHEVSQPLTALVSYGRSAKHRLQQTRGDAELAGLIDKILAEGQRSARIVRRLREFFRAGSLRLQPIAPAELLGMINRIGLEATERTTVSFTSAAQPGLPLLLADPLQIEVVLRNLLGNAVDSVQERTPASGRISVTVRRHLRERLCIAVADNGPGIPSGVREQLFRPFTSSKAAGMGLGLSLSRAIAEAHGGSLEAASASHGEFHLILPLEPAHG